jgi:catechol 2,3-dioxygenase-like lactoylglutathione lyase family enzyme
MQPDSVRDLNRLPSRATLAIQAAQVAADLWQGEDATMWKQAILTGALSLSLASPAGAQQVFPAVATMAGVKIGVNDFQRTIPFYTALGMRAGTKYNDHEMALEWPGQGQGVRIIMVRSDNGGALEPGGGFVMITTPDMAETIARLNAAGFANLGQPRTTPAFSLLMLKDPDGNQVELLGAPAKR